MLAYGADRDEKGPDYRRAFIPRMAGTTSVSATAPNSDSIKVISINGVVLRPLGLDAGVVPKKGLSHIREPNI